MSSNRQALVVMGALLHGTAVVGLVESARAEGTQVVFVGSDAGLTPRFPDWVIDTSGSELFNGTNLAAQLRAAGIGRLSIAGTPTAIEEARTQGFEAEAADVFA